MNKKIRFDKDEYINYFGMESLNLIVGWETVYEKLVHDNSLSNLGLGRIFLDRTLHVKYNWSFLKKHNFPRPSFWGNLVDRFLKGPNRINHNLRFTGVFRIIHHEQIHEGQRHGLYLNPCEHSYMSPVIEHRQEILPVKRILVPHYYGFKLDENQIKKDKLKRAYIPYNSDSESMSDDDFLKKNLYFHITDVISQS